MPGVVEATLRNTPDERHLAAFEADAQGAAGAGRLPLATAAGSAARARSIHRGQAAWSAFARRDGSGGCEDAWGDQLMAGAVGSGVSTMPRARKISSRVRSRTKAPKVALRDIGGVLRTERLAEHVADARGIQDRPDGFAGDDPRESSEAGRRRTRAPSNTDSTSWGIVVVASETGTMFWRAEAPPS